MIVSDRVGAKELVEHGKSGFIVEGEMPKLEKCIRQIIEKPFIVDEMNEYILEKVQVKTIIEHVKEIKNLYGRDFY